MTAVAVVAHRKKSFGGGLPELRRVLAERGISDPLWYEAPKGRATGPLARRAVEDGADLLFLWGGDGTVQHCLDAVAGTDVTVAILPAGTANVLARNLGLPAKLDAAVDVGLNGARRRLDVGVLNGKRFAVMAGVGLDAMMIKHADRKLKERFGRLAYVWTGAQATRTKARSVEVQVDGKPWFRGKASCVLLGQMGILDGGLVAFPNARPDDGLLEVGVVTANGAAQWARLFGRVVVGHPERSPLAEMTRGREVEIKLDRPLPYQLDGGVRPAKRRLRASIEPGAIVVCVPERGSR